tara:strand:+ start:9476 stop:10342 length:867 start_codon:yes stop_codon:yes gene_type:complete
MDNKQPGKDVSSQDLLDKFPLAAKSSNKKCQVVVNGHRFGEELVLFAGPNMVESEELIVDVARFLKEKGTHFLRGGAFKPLTFPYRSEKYTETREDGIRWLKTAKDETGIGIITEVMEIKYLPLICEVADIIQIGARNMQNYPLIIEAARTGKPIMLKRHFGCSIRDLLGAAEYILSNNNSNVILCERGISAPHTHRSTSRFLLDLQAVPALKELTHLPIAVDPSHACFWAPWVESLSLASVASGADAVMLEVHPDPRNAAVDPLQAINYEQYTDLFAKMNQIYQALN